MTWRSILGALVWRTRCVLFGYQGDAAFVAPIRIERPGVSVDLTIRATITNDRRRYCDLYDLQGSIALSPKACVLAIRAEIVALARMARQSGCSELRLAGRDWSAFVAGMGFEPLAGVPNGLRKVL